MLFSIFQNTHPTTADKGWFFTKWAAEFFIFAVKSFIVSVTGDTFKFSISDIPDSSLLPENVTTYYVLTKINLLKVQQI